MLMMVIAMGVLEMREKKKKEKKEKREQGSGRDGVNQEGRHVTSQGRLSTILYI